MRLHEEQGTFLSQRTFLLLQAWQEREIKALGGAEEWAVAEGSCHDDSGSSEEGWKSMIWLEQWWFSSVSGRMLKMLKMNAGC